MAKTHTETTELIAVNHGAEHHPKKDIMAPDVKMMLMTWVAFALLLVILSKYAWKPILNSLEEREKSIRDSVDQAEEIRQQMEKMQETKDEMISEAETHAKAIVTEARKAAEEAGKHIQEKAREEAQILIENAKREILDEKEKVQADLREESARIAVELAGKLIEENIDEKKNAKLVTNFMEDLS